MAILKVKMRPVYGLETTTKKVCFFVFFFFGGEEYRIPHFCIESPIHAFKWSLLLSNKLIRYLKKRRKKISKIDNLRGLRQSSTSKQSANMPQTETECRSAGQGGRCFTSFLPQPPTFWIPHFGNSLQVFPVA